MSLFLEDAQKEFRDRAEDDGQYAIAYALLRVARAIDRLGNADAATPMGGMEALGKVVGDQLEAIASALGSLADAVGEK